MRPLLLIIVFFISNIAFGQNCYCAQDTMLKENISCKPAIFENKARLFWNFNCDSSWLTFESPKQKRKIIFSLGDGLVSLTKHLGYMYWTEFNNTFLVTNHVISGCCDPLDYYVHDKSSGDIIKYLGRAIYVSENKKLPFVVSVTNSYYDTDLRTNYNSLTLYNLDSRKQFRINLPRGDIEKALKNTDYMFPEQMFTEPVIINDTLILKYSTDKYVEGKQLKYKTIKISLKKYRN